MKKKLDNIEIKIYKNIDDIKKKFPYPYNKEMLKLLKEENKFHQEYHYIKRGNSYSFLIIYKNMMNLLTFGKLKFYYPLKVIGYPCSLSVNGYITNDESLTYEYIKSIKGAKLVLNVNEDLNLNEFTKGYTLPTCIFKNNFNSLNEYINSLRSNYRKRINKCLKNTKNISIIYNSKEDIYDLYLNTYNKSNYKLEKLERDFFKKVNGEIILFKENDIKRGFILLNKNKSKLTFMLCGMNYEYDTTDLYYRMLLEIINYAINNKCKTIDFGQTSEETKLKMGCTLEEKYFYANHHNKIINYIVNKSKSLLEYEYSFPDYKVFKE